MARKFFGTDGIRGIAGQPALDRSTVRAVANARFDRRVPGLLLDRSNVRTRGQRTVAGQPFLDPLAARVGDASHQSAAPLATTSPLLGQPPLDPHPVRTAGDAGEASHGSGRVVMKGKETGGKR